MGRVDGRVALVTGGARGIGKAISEKLASEGAIIVMVDVMMDVAEEGAAEFRAKGYEAMALQANVAKMEDAEAAVKAVMDKYGRLDILVNNAGITKDNLMMRMTEEEWDAVIAVNLKGVFNFTKAATKVMMRAKYGKIVNISSVVGRIGNAGQANYSASKGGVIALTKTVAKEFASRNITCNAIAPGYISTPMTDALPQAARDAFLQFIPLKRAGKPEDVANGVFFFCQSESDYITGQVMNVDGGFVM